MTRHAPADRLPPPERRVNTVPKQRTVADVDKDLRAVSERLRRAERKHDLDLEWVCEEQMETLFRERARLAKQDAQ